jgi:hypothetical protein
MRRRNLKKSEYVLLGLFLMVAVFPLATATNGSSVDISPLASLSETGDLSDLIGGLTLIDGQL